MQCLTFRSNHPDTVLSQGLREGKRPALIAFGYSLLKDQVMARLVKAAPDVRAVETAP